MSDVSSVMREITQITSNLVEVGICTDQNFPTSTIAVGECGMVQDVGVSGANEISSALRERPYPEIYSAIRSRRAYNLLLIDGAMIQFRYRFQRDTLLKHVLAFYPSPDLLEFQNDPELYESEVLYADVVRKDIVTCPIRFDYDESSFVEVNHPRSHFTIGQYKNCRIPVSSALTPYRFMRFILTAFYNTPFRAYCSDWVGTASDFPRSVTDAEKSNIHLSYSALES